MLISTIAVTANRNVVYPRLGKPDFDRAELATVLATTSQAEPPADRASAWRGNIVLNVPDAEFKHLIRRGHLARPANWFLLSAAGKPR